MPLLQRLHPGNLRLRVAVFLFLLEQSGVGLGALQCVFGLLNFSGRSCALLLQAAESVQIALGGFARAARFDKLRSRA